MVKRNAGKASRLEHRSSADRSSDPITERPVQNTIDLNEWFRSRDIPVGKAKSIARKIRQHYPYLTNVLKESKDVKPELELIQLVFDTKSGRFPPTK